MPASGVQSKACRRPFLVLINISRCYTRPSSSSSKRWQARQGKDRYVTEARVQNLKSRAAFKLLEINERHKIFRKGQTVVDLGYAPGSWSQVAVDRTSPGGRVIGIDVIPAQPPRGVSTIQGNFLSSTVQDEVKRFLQDPDRGRTRRQISLSSDTEDQDVTEEDLQQSSIGYIDLEKRSDHTLQGHEDFEQGSQGVDPTTKIEADGKMVDVVLSDMLEPWDQTEGFYKRSKSNPYYRMMNTSGINTRDHAGSMDLCTAALKFAYDTLRSGGHFVCKFYQGAEDKALEMRLKALFVKVHREKPESSRKESKEAYFVALRRRSDAKSEDVLADL